MTVNLMKKKDIILLLSTLVIAGSAMACESDAADDVKAPENTIIEIMDNVYNKIDKAQDCPKAAKDLELYCNGIASEFNAASDKLLPNPAAGGLSPALQKIKTASHKFVDIADKKCAKDAAAQEAYAICVKLFEPINIAID